MCNNIILYPASLVFPGASRFDQLLALTERLAHAAETHTPHDQAQLNLCVDSLNTFLTTDSITQHSPAARPQLPTSLAPTTAMAPPVAPSVPIVPVTQSTRHRVPTQAPISSSEPSESAPSATVKFCTPILTSTPILYYGTLSPTRLPKLKIPWSRKSAKFASGARKARTYSPPRHNYHQRRSSPASRSATRNQRPFPSYPALT